MLFIIVPTNALRSIAKLILKLLPTYFDVLTPSTGNLQLCQLKL
jgi:hypothetical protein